MFIAATCALAGACEPGEEGDSDPSESDGHSDVLVDAASGAGDGSMRGRMPQPGFEPEVIIEPGMGGARPAMDAAIGMDAAADGAAPADSAVDSGGVDSGPVDSGAADTGAQDAAGEDAGSEPDAGVVDAGDPLACGLGQACCPDAVCQDNLYCAGQTCGCIRAIHGDHYLRTDGTVVDSSGAMAVIMDGDGARLDQVEQVYEGHDFGCARRADGTVWCWPTGSSMIYGAPLGRGPAPAIAAHVAEQVLLEPPGDGGVALPLTDVKAISAGSSECYLSYTPCAVRNDGSLVCWGVGDSGGGATNLFNGIAPATRSYATVMLASPGVPLSGVDAVTTGPRHLCVLRGGQVWCWGANVGGSVGVGDNAQHFYPLQVSLPGSAQELGAGFDFTCARVIDHVYCWGHNNQGQIGVGAPSPTNTDACSNFCKWTPQEVLVDATNGTALTSAGSLNVVYQGACVIRYDQSLWCWGAGAGNVAGPLSLAGNPVQDVALQTTCGSNDITGSLRYLSADSVLHRATLTVTPMCPSR